MKNLSFRYHLLAGLALFALQVYLLSLPGSFDPYAFEWPLMVVSFSAMIIAPLALAVLRRQRMKVQVPLLVFILAWAGMIVSVDGGGSPWVVPWLLVTVWIAGQAVVEFYRGPRTLPRAVILSGPVMLAVGGAWLFADRAGGMSSFGFDHVIVRLTAAHFHFAGFVLAIVAGLVLAHLPGRMVRIAAVGTVAGVPMVATGITLTRMGVGVEVESSLALVFSVCALFIGLAQTVLAWRAPAQTAITRVLLTVSGLSLMTGMTMAILYALRPWVLLPWLQNMPRMWAWHGTIQAFGFALPGLCGWLGWRRPDLVIYRASPGVAALQ